MTLSFPRNTGALKELINTSESQDLSQEELKYYEIFRSNDVISKSEFVNLSGLAKRTAERLLKDWTDKGILIRIGSGAGTKYKINE